MFCTLTTQKCQPWRYSYNKPVSIEIAQIGGLNYCHTSIVFLLLSVVFVLVVVLYLLETFPQNCSILQLTFSPFHPWQYSPEASTECLNCPGGQICQDPTQKPVTCEVICFTLSVCTCLCVCAFVSNYVLVNCLCVTHVCLLCMLT